LTFKVQQLSFNFRKDQPGLRPINFIEQSGKLIGIMGGSGTGKSTFLNVLNGSIQPTHGKVTINGIDVHSQNEQLQGIIGFISQDDLLIEELTVFQNLYFNAKIVFWQPK
jgi:ABC transport system ATP-binding/permease protein